MCLSRHSVNTDLGELSHWVTFMHDAHPVNAASTKLGLCLHRDIKVIGMHNNVMCLYRINSNS